MRVYLDTIVWNALHDDAEPAALPLLEDHEVLFSSCNLDEFALASDDRARSLAAFAWRISNKKKLLDHLELTAAEIRRHQHGQGPAPMFDDDPMFMQAWGYIRRRGVPREVRDGMQKMTGTKKDYRAHLRMTRDVFRPVFERFAHLGIEQAWSEILKEMDEEGSVVHWLKGLLEHEGLLERVPDPDALVEVSYVDLPATACWVEYSIGLGYLAAFEGGAHAKPDLGDQVDFRHAAYAGVADLFVTDDSRMRHVLTTMLRNRRAEIVDSSGIAGAIQ